MKGVLLRILKRTANRMYIHQRAKKRASSKRVKTRMNAGFPKETSGQQGKVKGMIKGKVRAK